MATPVQIFAIVVQVETAVAGTYAAPCAMTGRALNLTTQQEEALLPDDCDDALGAPSVTRKTTQKDASVTGNGVATTAGFAVWNDWYDAATEKNVRVLIYSDATTVLGYRQGKGSLANFNLTGNQGANVNFDVTVNAAGPWTYTAGAPA